MTFCVLGGFSGFVMFTRYGEMEMVFETQLYNMNIGHSCIERRFRLWNINPNHTILQNDKYKQQIQMFQNFKDLESKEL